ncbi:autotransporter domain-containing protein [uncultured Fusobacterium sp.]|uniref:autotransporter outer membrane beta-barrel domain-containing protein n=1 Tax=uncultured Fusobacterium sp. TaxID=159267 RepID=UPI002805CAF6|nr:autotransporter domain-containing protein [uncultured Fusobacterium sp.]
MSLKSKLIILTLLIETFSYAAKYDAELIVSGEDIVERIEETISNGVNGNYNSAGVDHGKTGGKDPEREALWVENKGTVHNIGKILSEAHTYETEFGAILGIGGVNNPLKKKERLVYLTDESWLINEGTIEMGATNQKIKNIIEVADLAFYRSYADYTKNVIVAENSRITNNGIIRASGDDPSYKGIINVSLLKWNDIKIKKNVINLSNSSLINSSEINCDRDRNLDFLDIVNVGLLGLGVHYDRVVSGVISTGNSEIKNINGGTIFVGGDIFEDDEYGGIGVGALGLDFEATHEKYGIKSDGGKIINEGTIKVEKDFSYGADTNGNILKLELIKDGVLGLDLLSFDNYKEKSIGVSINNGNFENNGGTIDVGANNKKKLLQIFENAAIAVQADNNSTVVFNKNGTEKSEVILEGSQVWLGSLTNNSKMELNGQTDIIFRTKNKYGSEVGSPEIIVNKDIFGNDGTGTYVINGIVNAKGEALIYGKNDKGESEVIGKEEFDTDITIGETSNVTIGTMKVEKSKEPITTPIINKGKFGQLNVSGILELKSNVKIDGSNLAYYADSQLEGFKENVILKANGGIITAEGIDGVISTGPVYQVKTEMNDTKTEISITDITRNSFRDLVQNKELGNIFETSYNGANEEQLAVYRLLAKAENQESFNKVVDEVTGKDTLTTLPAQIYDITRDLNGQFKDFAKNNRADGIVFKYINSKSELDANSSTVGFDRKSSGIMVGYNNNLSEKLRLGAGFSYMTSDIDYTSNSKNKVTTWNARGYSDYNLGFANIFNDLSFAYNQSENKRMADQLSYTGMKESDTDVYTLSLNNSLYKEYKFGDKLTLVPSLNLDFTYIWQDAIEEDGVIGASAKKVEAFYGTLGAGVDGKYNLLTLENSKLNLVGGIDYAYDIIRETDDMSLQVSAFDPYYKEELRELDKKYLDLNVGLNYEYKDSYSVGVKYTKELINDVDNDQFAVDFTYKF